MDKTNINYIEYFKKGSGIHIKKENRGKFTEYKKRTGKTTEECLHSKDPHVRKMANFARNSAKWKHEKGGLINYFLIGGGFEGIATGNTYTIKLERKNKKKKLVRKHQLGSALELLQLTPTPAANIASGALAIRDLITGNYVGAGLNAIGIIPGIGGYLGRGLKAGKVLNKAVKLEKL